MKVKQLKRKMAALLAVAMVMTGQPSGVLAGGMPGDSETTSTAGTETVSTVNDANKNTKPNGSEITVATKNTANSGTVGGTGTVPPKDEQDTFEVTYQVKPEEGAKVTGDRKVKTGETLEFTVRVNEGYELDSVSVSGDVLEPTKEEDNKYSYEAANIMQAPMVEVTLMPGIMLLADEASPSEVYVQSGENTESNNSSIPVVELSGEGTIDNPYNSLAYAVKKVADGGTVYLTDDFDLHECVKVFDKEITIDGQGYTITRSEDFATSNDKRSWYNPAMIEVGTISFDGDVKLALQNITLDDDQKMAGTHFGTQNDPDYSNTEICQDAIIASYASNCTVQLGNGTSLQNFGGMTAVRAADGAKLVMGEGSEIKGSNENTHGEKAAVALYNNAKLEMANGAVITDLTKAIGIRAESSEVIVDGELSEITGNGQTNQAAIYLNSESTLEMLSNGKIEKVTNAMGVDVEGGSSANIKGKISNVTGGWFLPTIKMNSSEEGDPINCCIIGENAVITENTVDWDANIYVNSRAELIVRGEITNNTANKETIWKANEHGVIKIENGALIKGNKAQSAVIYLSGWGSSLNMSGGKIDGNLSDSEDYSVVSVTHQANTAEITGGAIENNFATDGKEKFLISFAGDDQSLGSDVSSGYILFSSDVEKDDASEKTIISRNDSEHNYSLAISGYGRNVKTGVNSKTSDNRLEDFAKTQFLTTTLGGFWYQTETGSGEFDISDLDETLYKSDKELYAVLISTDENGEPASDAEAMLYKAEKKEEGLFHVSLPVAYETGYAVLLVQEGDDQTAEFATLGLQSLTFYAGGDYAGSEYNWSVGFPKARWTIDGQSVNDLSSRVQVNGTNWTDGYPFNISFINKDTGEELTQNASVEDIMGEYRIELAFKEGVTADTLTVYGMPVALGSIGSLTIRPLTELGDNEAQETAGIISDVANEHPTTPITGTALAVTDADTEYKVNNSMDLTADAQPALLFDKLLDTSYETTIKEKLSELGYVPETDSAQFDMRYLDLVDANDGNVWISSSKGTDIYWPYPVEDPENYEFAIYHFKGLHREYGVQGEEDAATRIENATIEDVEEILPEAHPAGLKFHIGEAGFSPFILTYKEKAQPEPEPEPEVQHTITINYYKDGTTEKLAESQTITLDAGEPYDVTAEASKTISGYRIVRTEGIVKGDALKSNIEINVYYSRISTGGGSPSGSGSSGSGSGVAYTVGLNGNWVHMDPNDINTPISQVVPDGANPVSNPEWHQWKFILTDGSALTNRWAFIRNPYAVEGQPSEGWFSFDENGIMNYGWYLDQSTGKWYFLHRQSDGMLGTMIEGWHHDEQDGRWYYLQPGSGEMLLGWQEIGGRWYYFNPNAPQVTWNYNEATGGWTYNGSQSRPYGSMYQNEVTPDGYQVDGSGAWVQ